MREGLRRANNLAPDRRLPPVNVDRIGLSLMAGVLAGCLAAVFVKPGGFGPRRDVLLALWGSVAASVCLRLLGFAPDARSLATIIVALVGAAFVILAQRHLWPRRP